jgi:hypothetical protein
MRAPPSLPVELSAGFSRACAEPLCRTRVQNYALAPATRHRVRTRPGGRLVPSRQYSGRDERTVRWTSSPWWSPWRRFRSWPRPSPSRTPRGRGTGEAWRWSAGARGLLAHPEAAQDPPGRVQPAAPPGTITSAQPGGHTRSRGRCHPVGTTRYGSPHAGPAAWVFTAPHALDQGKQGVVHQGYRRTDLRALLRSSQRIALLVEDRTSNSRVAPIDKFAYDAKGGSHPEVAGGRRRVLDREVGKSSARSGGSR